MITIWKKMLALLHDFLLLVAAVLTATGTFWLTDDELLAASLSSFRSFDTQTQLQFHHIQIIRHTSSATVPSYSDHSTHKLSYSSIIFSSFDTQTQLQFHHIQIIRHTNSATVPSYSDHSTHKLSCSSIIFRSFDTQTRLQFHHVNINLGKVVDPLLKSQPVPRRPVPSRRPPSTWPPEYDMIAPNKIWLNSSNFIELFVVLFRFVLPNRAEFLRHNIHSTTVKDPSRSPVVPSSRTVPLPVTATASPTPSCPSPAPSRLPPSTWPYEFLPRSECHRMIAPNKIWLNSSNFIELFVVLFRFVLPNRAEFLRHNTLYYRERSVP